MKMRPGQRVLFIVDLEESSSGCNSKDQIFGMSHVCVRDHDLP